MNRRVETPWLSAKDGASYLQTGRRTIYRAIRAGLLRAVHVGGRRDIRLRREWLDEFLERMGKAQTPRSCKGESDAG